MRGRNLGLFLVGACVLAGAMVVSIPGYSAGTGRIFVSKLLLAINFIRCYPTSFIFSNVIIIPLFLINSIFSFVNSLAF